MNNEEEEKKDLLEEKDKNSILESIESNRAFHWSEWIVSQKKLFLMILFFGLCTQIYNIMKAIKTDKNIYLIVTSAIIGIVFAIAMYGVNTKKEDNNE